MTMDPRVIAELERLARIELTAEERQRLSRELGQIIEYAGELKLVDTGKVAPGSDEGMCPDGGVPQSTGGNAGEEDAGGLRPDEPGKCLDRESALRRAPATDPREELYRVPRVIER